MSKTFPKDLTSYDLLKTLAVVFMIIDHLGWYFFPDDNWWRVAGRLCVPIWFFLIGYANTRALSPRLWIGAAILIVVSVVAGHYLFPFNILATMLIVRLVIDKFADLSMRYNVLFVLVCAVLAALVIPSNYIVEYGTQGLLLAMFGYIVRHYEKHKKTRDFVVNYGIFVLLAFILPQYFMHGFTMPQFHALTAGRAIVFLTLYHFKPTTFPVLTKKMPLPFKALLQFTGRRTLEIYVAHVVLFQFIALMQGDARFGWFAWKFMPELMW